MKNSHPSPPPFRLKVMSRRKTDTEVTEARQTRGGDGNGGVVNFCGKIGSATAGYIGDNRAPFFGRLEKYPTFPDRTSIKTNAVMVADT